MSDSLYHHGKHNSCCRGLDYPQQHKTGKLHQGEDMDLPQWYVAQIDQVRLMLGRHAKQPDSVKKLQSKEKKKVQRKKVQMKSTGKDKNE